MSKVTTTKETANIAVETPTKQLSKAQQKKAKKLGNVSKRFAKLQEQIKAQTPDKGKVSLTIAQQKESSEIAKDEILNRAKKKGMTKETVEKNQLRKLSKGERAFCMILGLGIESKRLKKSGIDFDDLLSELSKVGIKTHQSFLVAKHNAYQIYCLSPKFTKGNFFVLNIEKSEVTQKCLPFNSKQGFLTANPIYSKQLAELTKLAKSDKTLIINFVKHCNLDKVSYFK